MLSLLTTLVEQWLRLSLSVGLLYALCLFSGWSLVLTCLPHHCALRWIVYAPIAGMALLSALGLPLSLLGLSARTFTGPLTAALIALSILVSVLLRRRHFLFRRGHLFCYLRSRGWHLAIVATLVTVISAHLMTSRVRSDVRDYWGSTDFASYWSVTEYLVYHPATTSHYGNQSEFRARDIHDHLHIHARLGCMVFLAEAAALFHPLHVHRIVNVAIVTALLLLVGLGATWLDRVHCRSRWPLLIITLHPFLYFLLFFTYVSQVTSVVLTLAGFYIAVESFRGDTNTPSAIRTAIVAGLFLGCALLHYPMMSPAIGCFLALTVIRHHRELRSGPFRLTLAALLGGLVVSSVYYLPAVWREMTWLSKSAHFPGWNWSRPIGFSEFVGIRTVLGYGLPAPMTTTGWLLEATSAAFVLVAIWRFLCSGSTRLVFSTILLTTVILLVSAFWHILHGATNATHGQVKIVSLFAIVFVLACAVSWQRLFAALPRPRALLGTIILVGLWVPAELQAVRTGRFQVPRFREELIDLTRRQLAAGARPSFAAELNLDEQLLAPIVRDVGHIADARSATVIIGFASAKSSENIVDTIGMYAVRRLTP